MTYIMHTASRLLERPLGFQQLGRIDIARIAVRILVQLGRLARTAFAADMVAGLALLVARLVHSPAHVAAAADSLAHRLVDEVGPARARRHLQRRQRVARQPELVRVDGGGAELAGPDLGDLGTLDAWVVLILLAGGREARALLAARVLAIDAHLVRAEGRLAAVAGAVHSHANRLGDPRELEVGRRLPLAGLECQPVFGEEGARLLLLHGAIVGGAHGWLGDADGVADWGWGRCGGTMMNQFDPVSVIRNVCDRGEGW